MSALIKQSLGAEYPVVDHGKGVWLFDTEGRSYLDAASGAMTANIGHGVPEIASAIDAQLRKVAFTYRTQFTNLPAEELATRLTELAPGDLNYAFFLNSGSEASEHAIRVALHIWKERKRPSKTKILGRERSYHGMTMGALSMSGHDVRRKDYGPLLHPFPVVPPVYTLRRPKGISIEQYHRQCADAWEDAILEADPDTVAAVIAEPIVGAAGGALVPPEGYFKRVREICDKYDVLLILDEVITGMGRTGDWFASKWLEVVPDMLLVGKGLSAGYTPMAAVLMGEGLVESIRHGSGHAPFGHTFSGNPLSAATCLAVLDYMQSNAVLENVRQRGGELSAGLQTLSQRFRHMIDVRGRGLLWGFEFVLDRDTLEPPRTDFMVSARFTELCRTLGLIVYPAGVAPLNNSILLTPPLTIAADEVKEILVRLEKALIEMEKVLDGEQKRVSEARG
ncbi:aminotransferase class III-fold pyridoxal phosphate-dependent enzyme (plasmid) [Agrobacterium leguminum]|uniref:aminotransferase family protein n=1 Tax=Agrobacterium leguminum TaxID=2792015 RepID=UPI00272A5509|nr:aminotransferase class III-fold pyridoxal phosphate-dependent enzyme [Agrobacterium leguminum]WLE00816.1 aminotransferase class III-fold pyridoxal phosphate-dependent enzyme [Agrobacterium leguminum]